MNRAWTLPRRGASRASDDGSAGGNRFGLGQRGRRVIGRRGLGLATTEGRGSLDLASLTREVDLAAHRRLAAEGRKHVLEAALNAVDAAHGAALAEEEATVTLRACAEEEAAVQRLRQELQFVRDHQARAEDDIARWRARSTTRSEMLEDSARKCSSEVQEVESAAHARQLEVQRFRKQLVDLEEAFQQRSAKVATLDLDRQQKGEWLEIHRVPLRTVQTREAAAEVELSAWSAEICKSEEGLKKEARELAALRPKLDHEVLSAAASRGVAASTLVVCIAQEARHEEVEANCAKLRSLLDDSRTRICAEASASVIYRGEADELSVALDRTECALEGEQLAVVKARDKDAQLGAELQEASRRRDLVRRRESRMKEDLEALLHRESSYEHEWRACGREASRLSSEASLPECELAEARAAFHELRRISGRMGAELSEAEDRTVLRRKSFAFAAVANDCGRSDPSVRAGRGQFSRANRGRLMSW